MLLKNFRLLLFFFCMGSISSCSTTKNLKTAQPQSGITAIKFLGEYDIPFAFTYNNTTVGGLSGIDYDAKHHCYYMICDDRSSINPARFYTANIFLTEKGIDSVRFISVSYMLQPGGSIYPNNKKDPYNTPDPEAIRYDPLNNQLIWSSEGERFIKEKDTVLSDPAIRVIELNGKFADSFLLPANLHQQIIEKGPRQNSVFEGMSFADNYKTLFVSVEEPLYEDGPRADITANDAYIRILKFDVESKKNSSQYAYKLAPVAFPPDPATAFKINGVPDILSIGNDTLLIIERSFSAGHTESNIKIFMADLSQATDIKNISSLKENKNL